MQKIFNRNAARLKRQRRIRANLSGTPQRPRLSVFKSNANISAQIIDDTTGHTLVSASTVEKELKSSLESTSNIEAAKLVGQTIAKRALEKNIENVVFDRSGYIYHGKVKELADSAREAGLKF